MDRIELKSSRRIVGYRHKDMSFGWKHEAIAIGIFSRQSRSVQVSYRTQRFLPA